jgi:hypothetical protein
MKPPTARRLVTNEAVSSMLPRVSSRKSYAHAKEGRYGGNGSQAQALSAHLGAT